MRARVAEAQPSGAEPEQEPESSPPVEACPFPRGACGKIHPFPFARFGRDLHHHCEGTIHVTTSLEGPEAAQAAFAVYEQLLSDLAESPLRRLVLQARPVFVYVFPTVGECSAYLNRARAGGAIAAYHPSLSRVFIGLEGYEDYPCDFAATLRHELTHHLHDGRSRNSPLWLSEGLAEAYGESHPHALEARPLALDLEGLLGWGRDQRLGVARAVDRYFQATVLVRALLRDERTRETFVRYSLDPWPIHELSELAELLGLEVGELYDLFVQEYAASQDARVERERARAAAKQAARAEAAAAETVVVSGPAPGADPAPHAPEAPEDPADLTGGAFVFLLLALCGLGGLGLVLSRRGPGRRGPALPVA